MRSRITILVVVVLVFLGTPPAPAASPVSATANPTAGTNLLDGGRLAGRVLAMVEAGPRLYLAGEFTGIRSYSDGAGGVFDSANGGAVPGFPRLGNGQIKAVVADGSGGFYVAGTFSMVEGQARPGVAHFRADGSLTPWSPDVSPPGTVKALVRSAGGVVYVGGDFTAVAGQDRPGVAAVDGTSGALHTGFAPTLGPTVVRALALSPDGARLYVGGRVDPGGGGARRGLAALRPATGATEPWDPDVVGRVDTLVVAPADGRIYLGGDFNRVAGEPRLHVARLDPTSGAPDAWGEGADGPVAAMALSADGSRVFAGGEFTTLGGLRRRHVGALDAASGAVLAAWDPGADGPVSALAVAGDGSLLYVGGNFALLGATSRPGLGALDPGSGAVSERWVPDSGGTVETLAISGSLVLAGGRFGAVVERPRSFLAALSVAGGSLDPGFPTETDGPVRALALAPDGSRLFLGGDFGAVGGVPRPAVALVDASTGAVDTTFVPAIPNGPVRALSLSPDGRRLYMGGAFDSVSTPSGPVPRPAHLAALDAVTGALVTEWAPPPARGGAYTGQTGRPTDGVVAVVNALAASADGARVYAGGTFVDLGGRSGLVSLSAADGALTPWQPEMDRPVNSIFESSTGSRSIYVATGGFGGEVQAFDPAAKAEPVWHRHFDGDATAVVASAGTVYVGGHYDYVCEGCGSVGGPGDDLREHVAAFDAATGALDPWAPVANTKTGPYCAALGGSHLYIGGEFTRINDLPQPGVAQFPGVP